MTKSRSNATAPAAKGELVIGTGTDASGILSVGANDTVLTADSSTSTGLKWAAAGGGKVLQVVAATTTTQSIITTTTLTDTGITATITPTSATSKILVIVNSHIYYPRIAVIQTVKAQLLRGATVIADYYTPTRAFAQLEVGGASEVSAIAINPITVLDSPATTSATTYKLQAAPGFTANSGSLIVQSAAAPSTITLLEIGA